jgi:hypothetical protein
VRGLPLPEAAEKASHAASIARDLTIVLEDYSSLLLAPETEEEADVLYNLAVEKLRELLKDFAINEDNPD